jgi:hypothetical protein
MSLTRRTLSRWVASVELYRGSGVGALSGGVSRRAASALSLREAGSETILLMSTVSRVVQSSSLVTSRGLDRSSYFVSRRWAGRCAMAADYPIVSCGVYFRVTSSSPRRAYYRLCCLQSVEG